MRPQQFANLFCCNSQSGICLGVAFAEGKSGEIHQVNMKTQGGPCQIGAGQRCEFFEKAVLPITRSEQASLKTGEFQQVEQLYWKSTSGGSAPKGRIGRCGHTVFGRQKYCALCQRERQKTAKRSYYARKNVNSAKLDKFESQVLDT